MRKCLSQNDNHGLSVIELVVVLALLGLLLLVATPTLRAVFEVDLRQSSRTLAGTMRYLRDEATVRNATMRLAFDLDNNAWWVEAADGPVRIFGNRDERVAWDEFIEEKMEADLRVKQIADQRKMSEPDVQALASQVLGGIAGTQVMSTSGGQGADVSNPMAGLLAGLLGGTSIGPQARGGEFRVNEFRPMGEEEPEFGRHELPPSVRFAGAWTPAWEEAVRPMDEFEREAQMREEEGGRKWRVVYVHVFPGGWMEEAVIWLSEGEGDTAAVSSIVVESLTGRVRVVDDEEPVPDRRERGNEEE
jgi:prepilin-type N-terminal cleavage/methylation domain-containing protein